LKNPTDYWSEICQQDIESDEEKLLKLVNLMSPQITNEPLYGLLKEITESDFLSQFDINSSDKQILKKFIFDLPKLLQDYGLIQVPDSVAGYQTSLKPTYKGLVWELRRSFTIESKLIDKLVDEWETTNVDFKREINLSTKEQKAEFAKDVLGLATTKSSGKRYMIVGFDDKTRSYHAPPDAKINQDQMEQILSNLTEPVVNIRYEIVDYRLGKVGKLEIIRESEKLPYKAKRDVTIDERRTLGLKKDAVYVRHGSQTEQPTDLELTALEEEGKRSREEN
jgi:hypothetical protein